MMWLTIYFSGVLMTIGFLMWNADIRWASAPWMFGLMLLSLVVEKFYDRVGGKR